ncbi:uncharacterized protein BXZ73DRAFT_97145 [Epithele typhae]|uniref:uncharacterized protein n=1 Tax=Epithele typhae TaxID=378194 RepID=UPI002007EC86|nr:uncharacterized protein BXZ73DRAFT_97145 [Epithele typhae]KAH9943087.1 hypothetical protein BXZ73DRAFT_97145 [Epithele typhae]
MGRVAAGSAFVISVSSTFTSTWLWLLPKPTATFKAKKAFHKRCDRFPHDSEMVSVGLPPDPSVWKREWDEDEDEPGSVHPSHSERRQPQPCVMHLVAEEYPLLATEATATACAAKSLTATSLAPVEMHDRLFDVV